MRFLIIILFALSSSSAISQRFIDFTLPDYKEGQYRIDTVLSYFGPLERGSDLLGGNTSFIFVSDLLENEMVTGMSFIVVIDSVQQDISQGYAAHAQKPGAEYAPIYKNDTLQLPINLRVFRGDIGFRILVKGTPLVGGEEFPCQITDGGKIPESGMDIFFTSSFPSENCTVEPILNLNTNLKATVSIYPNPIRDYLQIDFIGANNSRELIVIDNKGMEVISITNVQTQSYLLNTNELKTGHYMLVVKNNNAIESRNGFVVN